MEAQHTLLDFDMIWSDGQSGTISKQLQDLVVDSAVAQRSVYQAMRPVEESVVRTTPEERGTWMALEMAMGLAPSGRLLKRLSVLSERFAMETQVYHPATVLLGAEGSLAALLVVVVYALFGRALEQLLSRLLLFEQRGSLIRLKVGWRMLGP